MRQTLSRALLLLATLYLVTRYSSAFEQADEPDGDHWHGVVRSAQLNAMKVKEVEELPIGIRGGDDVREGSKKRERMGDMVKSLLDILACEF